MTLLGDYNALWSIILVIGTFLEKKILWRGGGNFPPPPSHLSDPNSRTRGQNHFGFSAIQITFWKTCYVKRTVVSVNNWGMWRGGELFPKTQIQTSGHDVTANKCSETQQALRLVDATCLAMVKSEKNASTGLYRSTMGPSVQVTHVWRGGNIPGPRLGMTNNEHTIFSFSEYLTDLFSFIMAKFQVSGSIFGPALALWKQSIFWNIEKRVT
jgi:hypothetical protein